MEYQNTPKTNPFATASLIMGVLCIFTILTGILPLPLGALSILFAVLSHRRKKHLETPAFIGSIVSVVGMTFSIMIIAIAITMLPTMLRDPAYREQLNNMSESMYGMTFDEVMEEGYGIDLDELLEAE